MNRSRRTCLRLLPAVLLAPFANFGRTADASPLVIGVVPYLTARRIVELYEPLRAHLAKALRRPVLIESASDYAAYLQRTADGRYDLIATSPYFGRLAQVEQGYLPVARPLTDLEPLLIVRADDGPTTLSALRGRVVTTSDLLANLTLAARRHLAAAGMLPGVDVTVKAMGSHANSLAALERGESVAAVVSVTALRQIGGDWERRLRILARIEPTTPLLYLAHARLGEDGIERLRKHMFEFANDLPEGRRFVGALGHGGLKTVTEADMRALDPFVADLRGILAATP